MKISSLVSVPVALACGLLAQSAFSQTMVATSKPMVAAVSAGVPDPSMAMRVTVWLQLHDRQGLEHTIEQLYDPRSSTYHEWLRGSDLAQYAPTVAEVSAVKAELQSHGLTVLADDPARMSVRARGTVAQMESAFHTHIGSFRKDGATYYANTTSATLDGPAGNLTLSVSGLDNVDPGFAPTLQPPGHPLAGTGQSATAATGESQATGDLSQIITDRCFQPPQMFTLGTPGQPPYASLTGNSFDPGSKLCGFTPAQVSEIYGVREVHERGLRGEGQTIVLMEFYDSPTILDDVNAFAKLNGLPPLTSANFTVVYPDGKPSPNLPVVASWVQQTPGDVEWAHAMAPAAKIVLMIMPTPGDEEVQFGIYYAAMQHLGGVLSVNSSTPESTSGAFTAQAYDQVLALAAASGIAVNVSTGNVIISVGQGPLGNPGLPADSPHATAVGGTSLGIPDGRGGFAEVGLGLGALVVDGFVPGTNPPVVIPVAPNVTPLVLGARTQGGESVFFSKPAYQASLPCSGRCVPDIAAFADPQLGALLVFTNPAFGQQEVAVFGGTGLSAAIFSGIWTLANQHAHHWLGQAAPAIARMPRRALHDIVPVGSATNVSGTFVDSSGTATDFSPAAMFSRPGLTPVPAEFFSAFQNPSSQNGLLAAAWGWGLTGPLTVTKGWDNVTGFGRPNGMAFIDAAAHERQYQQQH